MEFFTRSEIAEMRDRTRSRRYSPAREEFRREHARHRAWGLVERHARKLRRLHGGDDGSPLTATERRLFSGRTPAPTPETAELTAAKQIAAPAASELPAAEQNAQTAPTEPPGPASAEAVMPAAPT